MQYAGIVIMNRRAQRERTEKEKEIFGTMIFHVKLNIKVRALCLRAR